ncbi:MAG TPA: pseudouridine synthase [Acidimicrobiia bacterium]|nr:pseudouridine synthase [Acidimicrobiia bacterium]
MVAEPVRAQKAIANSGLMSRRSAEEAIAAGRVAVDGHPIGLGDRVDVSSQLLTIDGVPIPLNPELETHLVYKPPGVISTASDPQGRPVVVDLAPSTHRLYPVGRLDSDSEGLILLTNDGELANRVTHPRYGITKKYVAVVAGHPTATEVRRLVTGVQLSDGPARALSAHIVSRHQNETIVEMVLGEGRNRVIRRMFEAIGHEVIRLVRTAIGPLSDQSLQPGESRLLSIEEIRRLLASGKAEA